MHNGNAKWPISRFNSEKSKYLNIPNDKSVDLTLDRRNSVNSGRSSVRSSQSHSISHNKKHSKSSKRSGDTSYKGILNSDLNIKKIEPIKISKRRIPKFVYEITKEERELNERK